MKKTIYIDANTKIKEQAEHIADMAARQQGFNRNSPKWQKIVHQILTERYTKSSTPYLQNPRSPIFEDDLFDNCEAFKLDKNVVKAAVTALAQLYTEKVLGLKTGIKPDGSQGDFSLDDMFGVSKEDKKAEIHKKLINIYTRYFVGISLMFFIDQVFKTPKEDMLKNANALGFFNKSIEELKKPETRIDYANQCYTALKTFYENKLK